MLRLFAGGVTRTLTAACVRNSVSQHTVSRTISTIIGQSNVSFLTHLKQMQISWITAPVRVGLLNATPSSLQLQPSRSVTKFSLKKGKRKSVKAVLKRFKRLDWGIWIRTYCGRNKKMFKKSPALKRRLRQHVFTNATQSWLLDSMVTNFWRRPKYYIDDPYEPYHKRDEYFATKSKTLKI